MTPESWSAPAELRSDPNPGFLRSSLHLVYDVAWALAAVVGLPWLVFRSLRSRAFREMTMQRMGRGLARLPRRTRPRVLVHGVSVGEVKAALPVVRGIAARHPEVEVVICTTTDTGLEVAKGLFPDHLVVRFPVDPSLIVARFLRHIDPSLILLVELEIWPNFLRACNRSARPVAVINGRITEMSHIHYVFFRDVLPQFNRISLFCVQLDEYARRFLKLHVEPNRVLTTGNVKVDGLRIGRVDPGDELRRFLGPADGQSVIVAGSTHDPEEEMVAKAWRSHASEARLVLVPRHPRRGELVATRLEALGFQVRRLSRLRTGDETGDPEAILVVDTIGELERVYGLADLVFVGGTLIPHGGQNMLEPAAQARAIVFGPHVTNFAQEAALLERHDACLTVADEAELGPAIAELLGDPQRADSMGRRAQELVAGQTGATHRTLDAIDALALDRIAAEARGVSA